MRTSNPALGNDVFRTAALEGASERSMTLEGAVGKTGVLLAILVATAGFTWVRFMQVGPESAYTFGIAGAIGGLILGLITTFKPTASPYTAPLYAAAEGLFLGAISAAFETQYHGIVTQAVAGTFGTLAAMLLAYATRVVRATENFKLGVVAATGGICLLYLASWILSFFGIGMMNPLFGSTWIGIGFSVFVVAIAALNLVLDFDFIESGVRDGAPKYMEWYAGFGLLVTLVWLYLEILRLLSKLNSRD